MSALPGKVDASVVEILLGNKMTDSRAEGAIEPREFQLPLVPSMVFARSPDSYKSI